MGRAALSVAEYRATGAHAVLPAQSMATPCSRSCHLPMFSFVPSAYAMSIFLVWCIHF